MNRIPTSLAQPFLKSAIVELWFKPKVKAELLPGIFYERLREDWSPPGVSPMEVLGLGLNIRVEEHPPTTFRRGVYTLSVNPSSVVFNVDGDYPGWADSYLPLLTDHLPTLLEGDMIKPQRCSLRYVNHVPTEDLFTLIGRYQRAIADGWQTKNRTIRNVISRDGYTAVIILTTNENFTDQLQRVYGIIDVAIHRNLPSDAAATADKLLNFFADLHRLNKEIVFGELLPKSYVADFGAQYDE